MIIADLKITEASEETLHRVAKALYINEDGDGGATLGSGITGGGLSSASDLGMLPKPSLGGTGIGFEQKKRKEKMQSEESLDEEYYTNYAKHVISQIDKVFEAKSDTNSYMVSWMDPKITKKIHTKQKRMGNGLPYVLFKDKKRATEFYTELRDAGIDNLKLDSLGGIRKLSKGKDGNDNG